MATPTSQDPADKAPGSEPVKDESAQKDTREVPLAALAESRQKARAAEEKAAKLEAELARLEAERAAASAQPRTDIESIGKQLQEIQSRERLRELTSELGLADQKQAQAVAAILADSPKLTPTEALDIAAKRNPDSFKDRGVAGFDPRTHTTLRPASGGNPEPKKSDHKRRIEHIKTLSGTDKKRYLDNIAGSFAAKAMGWVDFHQKLPIPDQQ